jgi:MFS family permease
MHAISGAEQLGRVGAVTFIGLVGGILVTGPLADRWGGRIFAVGGNGLIAMGLTTLHWTIDYPMLLGAAFIGGVGGGILDMILSPIVSSLTRGQSQNPALNVLHSFYCVGAIVTILAGSLALRFGLSWRILALGLLPMPVIVGLAFSFLPMPSLIEAGRARIRAGELMRQRFFLLTMVTIFLGGATEVGMAYWLPAYAEKSLGYASWTAALAFLGFSLAMTVGTLGIILTKNGQSYSPGAGLLCGHRCALPDCFIFTKPRTGGRCLHFGGAHRILPLADHPRNRGGSLSAWGSDDVCSARRAGKFRWHFHAVGGGGSGRPLGITLGSGQRDVMSPPDDFGFAMDGSVTNSHKVDRTDVTDLNGAGGFRFCNCFPII